MLSPTAQMSRPARRLGHRRSTIIYTTYVWPLLVRRELGICERMKLNQRVSKMNRQRALYRLLITALAELGSFVPGRNGILISHIAVVRITARTISRQV